jgi:hypothetical protein
MRMERCVMKLPALVALLLGLVGCGTTADVMRLDDTSRAPTSASRVAVLVSEPSRPYSTIAVVEVSDQGWGLPLEQLKQEMQKQAAALGGDAVIVGIGSANSGAAFVPIGNMYYAIDQTEKKLTGKVIVYSVRQ